MPGQHKRCSGSCLISQKSTKIKDTSSGRFSFGHPVLPSRWKRMIVYLDFVMAVRFSTHPTRPSSHRPCGCHRICGTTICRYIQLGALTRWESKCTCLVPSIPVPECSESGSAGHKWRSLKPPWSCTGGGGWSCSQNKTSSIQFQRKFEWEQNSTYLLRASWMLLILYIVDCDLGGTQPDASNCQTNPYLSLPLQ